MTATVISATATAATTTAATAAAPGMTLEVMFDLLNGKNVPGVDRDDPDVRVLQEGLATKTARTAFTMAQRDGFLQVELGYGFYPDGRMVTQLVKVWEIWCQIRNHPPVTLTVLPDGEGRLRCDLTLVGLRWEFAGMAVIGKLLAMKRPRPGYGWTFTREVLEVDGLEAGDAVAMARGVVWLLTRGKSSGESEDSS